MPQTLNPASIGDDQDIELAGTTQIPFTVTNKPAFKNGDNRVVPIDGQITVQVTEGRLVATFAQVDGYLINEFGRTTRKKVRVLFDFPASEDEHPDYLAPDWLAAFVSGLQDRLNGTIGA